ncbi:hypothetical protein SBA4_1010015 [Candidatus Sulfopaludibacter sp. SbA4]|nr:hypothetical protein SBA4_1010015 [Candidatus Sulfopaludibacter sp. SbA4]
MPTGIAMVLERRKRRPVRLGDIVELNYEFILQIFQMQVALGINNVNGAIPRAMRQPGGANSSSVSVHFSRCFNLLCFCELRRGVEFGRRKLRVIFTICVTPLFGGIDGRRSGWRGTGGIDVGFVPKPGVGSGSRP